MLLLDEPFSALDAFTRVDLQDHLLDLWAELKPTLILVTHDVEEAIVLADRIMVMRPRPGRISDEIEIDLPRPRDRQSAAFDFAKRRVLAALDRSLDRTRERRRIARQGRRRRRDVVVMPRSAMPAKADPATVICACNASPGLSDRTAFAGGTAEEYDDACAASRSAPAASRCSATRYPTPKPTGTEVLLRCWPPASATATCTSADGYFDLGGGKRLSSPTAA